MTNTILNAVRVVKQYQDGTTKGKGNIYPSGAPEFTLVFTWFVLFNV
jgi:hypothetical protein